MTGKKAKNNKANILVTLALLAFAFLIFVSCGGEQAVEEEQAPEVPEYQEKMEEMEQELMEKDETIAELQEANSQLQNQIPVSHEVEQGESHWEIAFDYLREKGLTEEEAANKLSDALLYHPILVGYKIWHYFYEGTFGSFITQGTADVSPGTVMRHQKQEASEEKMDLENQIAQLQDKRQGLMEQMDHMQKKHQAEKETYNERIESLENELQKAEGHIEDFELKLNSVYYLAGSKEELKDRGVIKGTFLGICGTRIGDVTAGDFSNSLDLRESDTISLASSDLGIPQVKKVDLLPKHLQEGEDYRVEISGDRQSAQVILLNKEKVRLGRLIIFAK